MKTIISKDGILAIWAYVLLRRKYRKLRITMISPENTSALSKKEILLAGISPELQQSKLWLREDGIIGINEVGCSINNDELQKAAHLFDERIEEPEVCSITQAVYDILLGQIPHQAGGVPFGKTS